MRPSASVLPVRNFSCLPTTKFKRALSESNMGLLVAALPPWAEVLSALVLLVAVGVAAFVKFFTPKPKAPPPSKEQLSKLDSEPKVYLSLVFPAYNEEKRLASTLQETLQYLEARKKKDSKFTFEVLVIDDGSKDKTVEVAQQFAKGGVRLIKGERNRGKGGAVRLGVTHTVGSRILFLDSDNATKIDDLDKVDAALDKVQKDGYGVSIGSRAHLAKSDTVKILGVHGVDDTQCGFKMFTRKAAAAIFPNQHVDGWIFDIELLLIAQSLGIPIAEVPVRWQEVDGSKMDLIADSIKMFIDLLAIRLNYLLGNWRIEAKKKTN